MSKVACKLGVAKRVMQLSCADKYVARPRKGKADDQAYVLPKALNFRVQVVYLIRPRIYAVATPDISQNINHNDSFLAALKMICGKGMDIEVASG